MNSKMEPVHVKEEMPLLDRVHLFALQSGEAVVTRCSVNYHMAQWNLFYVVNSVILKFPADDL